MCGRFTNRYHWSELVELYRITEPWIGPASNLQPSYNVAPMQRVVAARLGHQGGRHPFMAQWNLQSHIPKQGERWKLTTFNATIEKLRTGKRSVFSHAWAEGQRCVMPASEWYEWPEPKQPRYFRRMSGATFAFAGLWESIKQPDGEDLISCTIVTVLPNPYVATYHDRAPMILTPELFDVWLEGSNDDADELCEPMTAKTLRAGALGPPWGIGATMGPS